MDCGTCNLCCKLPAIPETGKPVGVWCEHCIPGSAKGCKIYEDRPESCKNFRCIWLSGGFPDYMRPDKVRVIFERLPSGKTYLVLLNPGYEDAWKQPKVRDFIGSFIRANKAVVVGTKPARYFIPKGRTKEEVREDLKHALEYYGLMPK